MSIVGKNIIAGSFSGTGTETFEGLGGKQSDKPAVFFAVTEREINLAVSKAQEAFLVYKDFPAEKKVLFFEAIIYGIEATKDEILAAAVTETRLSSGRLQGEMHRTINQINLFSTLIREGSWVNAVIDTADLDRKPLPKPDLRQMQIPIGPVAVFGASNFPLAFSVAGGDTISALAAGCPVVYKAHPGHPVTSELIGKIVADAAIETGMPEGIFSMLQGVHYSVSTALVTHPGIKAVAFTGSFVGGRALLDAAAQRKEPIPVYAEMGSINPVFVLPEIMAQNSGLASKIAASNTLSAGQFCTNPGLIIYLQAENTNQFLSEFRMALEKAPIECTLTRKIHDAYYEGIQKFSKTPGVETISVTDGNGKNDEAIPIMFKTTSSVFLNNEVLNEEIFGPSSLHVIASDILELRAIAEKIPGQLTISVWGTDNDFENNRELIGLLQLKAGRIICNAVPTGVEVTHAMVHGGPYPATTDSRSTSVGTNAIYRFTRAICYQNFPPTLLPGYLKNANPRNIWRKVNGKFSNGSIN